MSPPDVSPPAPDLGVLAAVVARQSADLSVYADFLTGSLAAALPADQITVERQRGRFGRSKDDAPVLAVTLRLGDRQYALRRSRPGASAQASVSHVVNGIVLSTTQSGIAQWAQEVAAALATVSESNADAASTLAQLTRFTV